MTDAAPAIVALPASQGGDAAAMERFRALFDDVHFGKGLEIVFCQAGKGRLLARIGGKDVRRRAPPAFACWSRLRAGASVAAGDPLVPLPLTG